eukprot:TRINITY_DN65748_c3_g1_i1.p1 TRINITY_DN65748_c3_g1~~TRINITY_DN65748_c3_g1_i1.p1  ORF type:complete len:702 (+),score=142.22 TRINITY_DN65748_c3_g1_i1:48-2108(+)
MQDAPRPAGAPQFQPMGYTRGMQPMPQQQPLPCQQCCNTCCCYNPTTGTYFDCTQCLSCCNNQNEQPGLCASCCGNNDEQGGCCKRDDTDEGCCAKLPCRNNEPVDPNPLILGMDRRGWLMLIKFLVAVALLFVVVFVLHGKTLFKVYEIDNKTSAELGKRLMKDIQAPDSACLERTLFGTGGSICQTVTPEGLLEHLSRYNQLRFTLYLSAAVFYMLAAIFVLFARIKKDQGEYLAYKFSGLKIVIDTLQFFVGLFVLLYILVEMINFFPVMGFYKAHSSGELKKFLVSYNAEYLVSILWIVCTLGFNVLLAFVKPFLMIIIGPLALGKGDSSAVSTVGTANVTIMHTGDADDDTPCTRIFFDDFVGRMASVGFHAQLWEYMFKGGVPEPPVPQPRPQAQTPTVMGNQRGGGGFLSNLTRSSSNRDNADIENQLQQQPQHRGVPPVQQTMDDDGDDEEEAAPEYKLGQDRKISPGAANRPRGFVPTQQTGDINTMKMDTTGPIVPAFGLEPNAQQPPTKKDEEDDAGGESKKPKKKKNDESGDEKKSKKSKKGKKSKKSSKKRKKDKDKDDDGKSTEDEGHHKEKKKKKKHHKDKKSDKESDTDAASSAGGGSEGGEGKKHKHHKHHKHHKKHHHHDKEGEGESGVSSGSESHHEKKKEKKEKKSKKSKKHHKHHHKDKKEEASE